MSNEEAAKVRRTLQMRFTLPSGDSAQLIAMIKAAAPFYQMFGNAQVRLLQNVDDPAKLIQEIEYEAHEDWELNRQRIAGDLRMQTFLQTWRTMFPGALEIDVFQEVWSRTTDDGRQRADILPLHPTTIVCRSVVCVASSSAFHHLCLSLRIARPLTTR